MHEIEVILWCQRLLVLYDDQLVLINGILQCRKCLIVDVVQIHTLNNRTELAETSLDPRFYPLSLDMNYLYVRSRARIDRRDLKVRCT